MFFTAIDPRAKIKGSRDPLGLVPLWSHFGRHVVGNLTTVTDSVRGFTTTLLGYHFAREARELSGGQGESALALFLKFEQLAAYSRWGSGKDGGFRGVDRVRRRLADEGPIRVSAAQGDQILSNQRVYGLWGLFSGPARASGLLDRHEAVLSPEATAFVAEQYVSALDKAGFRDGRAVADILRQTRTDLDIRGKHRGLADALARLHGRRYSVREREFYGRHLVEGGSDDSTRGLQRQAAELMRKLPPASEFGRDDLRAMIKMAATRGDAWEPLAHRLRRIDQLESLLVPAAAAFGFVLGRGRGTTAGVAKEIRKAWGRLAFLDTTSFGAIREEIGEAYHDAAAGERWVRLGQAMAGGDHDAVLDLLVEHNAFVMRTRSGSDPWVRSANGVLEVRFRDSGQDLLPKENLEGAWDNNYFLNPLKRIATTLAEA